MTNKKILIILLVFFCFIQLGNAQGLSISSLKCEYLENPLGLNTSKPRFAWILHSKQRNQHQASYEIIVSKDLSNINKGIGTEWNSQEQRSSSNNQIVYAGKPLTNFTRYYWRVRVKDGSGKLSKWSDVHWFETAVLPENPWDASWISNSDPIPNSLTEHLKDRRNPIFRKLFSSNSKIKSARLYISGLGYYEAYLNGKKIGDRKLEPGWTSYEEEILYSVYDIADLLKIGANQFSVELGNGWYNLAPLKMWGSRVWRDFLSSGKPKVTAKIRLVDEQGKITEINSDQNWETAYGAIQRNDIYLGEHADASLLDPQWATTTGKLSWTKAVTVPAPKGAMRVQMQPAIKVTQEIKPKSVKEVEPGVYLFDMGKNFAGVARIHVKGPAGQKVTLRFGEDVYPDGKLNVMTSVAGQIKGGNGGEGAPQIAWQEDSYTLKGSESVETWEPKFTFHGFRYVEVKGWPGVPQLTDIVGLRMNADLQRNGSFHASNDLFNQIDELIQTSFLSNVFSVVSDCPAREKLAYGGDILCAAETFMYNYDMSQFYSKTIRDHVHAQRPEGGITETAPFVGIADDSPGDQSGPLGYQAGLIYLIHKMYEFYGDQRLIETYYPNLKKQVDFLIANAQNHLFESDLGDHESLEPKNKKLTASIFYHLHLSLLSELAGIIGKQADAQFYLQKSKEVKQAIHQAFYDSKSGQFGNATQSDQLFGIWSGMISKEKDQKAFSALKQYFEKKDWHLSTGIFGTKMLFDVLREHEENQWIYRIANQETFPSWGHMVKSGATSLWETWQYSDNTYSQNHPMFGSIGEWYYRSILGINALEPGFKKIQIKPQLNTDLKAATGSYQSIQGLIKSAWKKLDEQVSLQVSIPVNTSAEVWIFNPNQKAVLEGNKKISQNAIFQNIQQKGEYSVISIGSGDYQFEID